MILELRDQIADLKTEREEFKAMLFKVTHLVDQPHRVAQVAPNESPAQPQSPVNGRNWAKVRSRLEAQHRRQPEDQTADYWKKKNEEMEQQVPEMAARLAESQDEVKAGVEELSDVSEVS